MKRKGYWDKFIVSPPDVFTPEEELTRLDVFLGLASTVTSPFKNIVLRYEPDPAAAWKALEERFKGNEKVRKVQLKSRLQTLSYDRNKGVVDFFAKVRDLYNQIYSLDDTFTEFECVHMVLASFPRDMFDSVKVNLKNAPDVTLTQAEYMLTSQEADIKQSQKNESAFVARSGSTRPKKPELIPRKFFGPNCWHCNDPSHRRPECAQYKAELAALQRGHEPARAEVAWAGSHVASRVAPRTREIVEMGF